MQMMVYRLQTSMISILMVCYCCKLDYFDCINSKLPFLVIKVNTQ